jgi:two-component system, sensor histidine kinase
MSSSLLASLLPENRQARLAALMPYEILDTASEKEYDALVRLAAYIASTPIAFISLIDDHRQWYKSRIGFQVEQLPIEEVFCRYTVMYGHMLEVENTALDARFEQDLLVREAKVHFYCGVPLITPEGLPIGSLCVSDLKPKVLSEEQKDALQTLAGEVMARLQLRKQHTLIEHQKKQLLAQNEQLEEKVTRRTDDLLRSNLQLSDTKAQLDMFLYRASHDLKGPLCSLQGLISLADTEQEINKFRDYLQMMGKLTNKLERVLTNLLVYSHNMHTPVRCELIHLESLISAVRQSCQHLKGYSRVNITADLPTQASFYSDGERLKNILHNIVENSIVFQNYNLSESVVKIKGTCREDKLRILIEDNGIGVPPESISSAFHMSTKFSGQSIGSGLGLFVAKALVDTLKGSISLVSRQGQGTTVSLEIPGLALARTTDNS